MSVNDSQRVRWWTPAAWVLVSLALVLAPSASAGEEDSSEGGALQIERTNSAAGPRLAGSTTDIQATGQAAQPLGPRYKPGFASVLVYMEPPLTRAALRRQTVRDFAAGVGGRVKYEYKTSMPNVLNLRNIPESQITALEQLSGVVKVELDEYHPNALALHDSTELIRGLESQVTGAGYAYDGSGVRICIVDTGIDSDHAMFSDRIDTAAGHDFFNDDSNPEDDHGHGSHCSGIALGGTGLSVDFGCGAGSQTFQGVAPGATLVGVKVLNSGGGGYDSDIIAGIDYAADQTASGARCDVISMSIGIGSFSSNCSHSWAVAANNAVANGVVAVAASGNDNFNNAVSSPACGAEVISVGATYKAAYPTCENNLSTIGWGNCTDRNVNEDDIVCFSNEATLLDVVAPGAIIWSASTAAGGNSITGMGGTSMACPHVAGLAALILDADPTLTPPEVRKFIRDGVIDLGAPDFDTTYGYGRVDVLNSLALVEASGCSVDADCNDGLFCNGAETCPAGSCVAGNDPCPGESCDEVGDVCFPLVCDDDGMCEAGEDCDNCPSDCISGSSGGAVCGNNTCEAGDGEDCVSCPSDCNGVQTGRPANRYCCGDGDGSNPLDCADPACKTDGNTCTDTPSSGTPYCCGDTFCDGAEDSLNCEVDCGAAGFCGDGTCDPGEDQCSCPSDCGSPSAFETSCSDGFDNDCDGDVDCADGDCAGDPVCACGVKNDPCDTNADCCSDRCNTRKGTCR
jgi:subtilisin family serine protease